MNNYIRPRIFKVQRIDRRKKCYQRKDKACVLFFRQQAANQEQIKGADRSIVALTKRLVTPNSTLYIDENSAYDHLAFHYDLW